MNSYNENLQSIVLSTLQNQDLDQKNLQAQDNASQFTLYYAQGAVITATEKLDASEKELKFKTSVKEQAVANTNISNNLLNSATQANQYLGQAVSNTAICASNVQLANIAITKLSSDIGGIFSIVSAADFGSAIYNSAENVYGLITETAYDAEVASRLAMDASAHTSEVSSSTVLDNAKSTGALMNNLMQIASSEYDAKSKLVAADNTILASASAAEKIAEGSLKCIDVDSAAAEDAYNSINNELNLNLNVTNPSSAGFTVNFNPIKSPFKDKDKKDVYPVTDYYIIVVKDSKKLVFSMSNAENLLSVDKKTPGYYKVPPQTDVEQAKKGKPAPQPTEDQTQGGEPGSTSQIPVGPGPVISSSQPITTPVSLPIIPQNGAFPFTDSDGDPIGLGVNYVVFVLAVYDIHYKQKVNDFEDFLSAPSQTFSLTKILLAVPSSSISIKKLKQGAKTAEENENEQNFRNELQQLLKDDIIMAADLEPQTGDSSTLTYSLTFNTELDPLGPVSYRCMLLPYGKVTDVIPYDTEIATLEFNIASLETQIKNSLAANQYVKAAELEVKMQELIAVLSDRINQINKENTPAVVSKNGPGFIFNEMLAEQVKAGNYIPAVQMKPVPPATTGTPPEPQPATSTTEADANAPVSPPPIITQDWIAYIGSTTTDNFGNLLMSKELYIPVILTVPNLTEKQKDAGENTDQFTNALSATDKVNLLFYKD